MVLGGYKIEMRDNGDYINSTLRQGPLKQMNGIALNGEGLW